MNVLFRLLPFLSWWKGYDRGAFRADLVAGVTVALVLVPQSMAYAQLAGMPAYYGLYAAFLPSVVAALFGSSRQLATGPVAVVSLVVAAALEPLATAGSQQYIAYAVLLALVAGLVQLVLGLARLGMIVNFLSHPVVNGFTNAAAIIIATSQLSKLFGVREEKAAHHYETVYRVVLAAVHGTHWPTFAMAAAAFVVMIGLKRWKPRWPNVLVAAVVTTAISWASGFARSDTVALASIESEQLVRTIHAYNEAIAARDHLETLRKQSRQAWDTIAANGYGPACTDCHGRRDLKRFVGATSGTADPPALPDKALALHGSAGLLDKHIAVSKREVASLREELRKHTLVRTVDPNNRCFVPANEPAAAAAEPGNWRLNVGDGPLSADALHLVGGGAVIGRVPKGLPRIAPPRMDLSAILALLPAAMIISLLGFMEAISIAKAMAARTRQKLDANQELVGQGLANIVGSFSLAYPVSGSFSRSAVNLQSGGRTGLANVVSGLVVLVVLLFLSPLLYHLPQAVLAAIIMMAVIGLVKFDGFVHAWRTSRLDGAVFALTFAATLVFAPHLEWGIALGVAMSLGAYLYRTMRPAVVELAPHPDGAMRDAKRHALASCKHIAVIGFEGPLNFASVAYLEDAILARVAEKPELRQVVIAGNGISEIDASGEETLRHLVENLRAAHYEVALSGIPDAVMDVLRRSGLRDLIGESQFYGTRAQAIAGVFAPAHAGGDESACPFLQAMPPVIELSLHPDGSLRNAARHGLRVCRHIAAMRFDAPLSYANSAFLEEEIVRRLADRPGLRHVIFVCHGISEIDEMGAAKLVDLVNKLRAKGYAVSFSGLKEDVVAVLERCHAEQVVGPENMHPTQAAAVAAIYARAHTGSSEDDCPLEGLAPHLTELSLHPEGTLRSARSEGLQVCEAIALLRLDGPLVLASRRAIQSEFIRWAKRRPSVKSVILVGSALHRIERDDAGNLLALVEEMRAADYNVALAGFTDRALEVLSRTGVADAIGLDAIWPNESLALANVFSAAHGGPSEAGCPLRGLVPMVVQLSLSEDGSLRDAQRHNLALCSRIVAVRFDGPLNIATVALLGSELESCLEQRPDARHVLLAGHTLERLDAVAAEELVELLKRLRESGITVAISGLKDNVLDLLRRGAPDLAGARLYPTQVKAIEQIHAEAHRGAHEPRCPLLETVHK